MSESQSGEGDHDDMIATCGSVQLVMVVREEGSMAD